MFYLDEIKPLRTIEQELAECRKAFQESESKVGDWVWCCHHEKITEVLTEPWGSRVAYIMSNKPEHERASRLRAFRPVVGKLPTKLRKARDAHDKARDAHDKARDAHDKARDAYDEARDAYDEARDAYDEARDAYYKARDAYYKAWDVFLPTLNKQIKKEWPDTTWNGKKVEGT